MTTVNVTTSGDEVKVAYNGNEYFFPKALSTATYIAGNNSITLQGVSSMNPLSFSSAGYSFVIDSVPFVGSFQQLTTNFNDIYFVDPTPGDIKTYLVSIDGHLANIDTATGTISGDTANIAGDTANIAIDTSNIAQDSATINTNTGNTATNTSNSYTELTNIHARQANGVQKTQIVSTGVPTRATVTSLADTGNGTVAAGAIFIEFITGSTFSGTINGVAIPNLSVSTYPYMPGIDYPAISYTVTAGTLYIRKITV